ncbi:MAG: NUDIX domain-containing protein [Gemmataceae bacterium]
MKQSSGTLLYRQGPKGLEVLLVHPSGNYNRHKPWSIPKGVPDEGEELAAAALRETREETGVKAAADTLIALGHIEYVKSRKRVHAFAAPAPADAAPTTASWEVDRAEFVALERARELLHPDQRVFLERLLEHLNQT